MLSVGGNQFEQQSFPTYLLKLTNLNVLEVFESNLIGKFPVELPSSLSRLQTLLIQQNDLTGNLPSSLALFQELVDFKVDTNKLVGTIPIELGNLGNLTTLSLAHNGFTGSLPSELGKLRKLEDLIVSFNSLTGIIPLEICGLWDQSLEVFHQPGILCNSNFYGGAKCPNDECCPFCNP